MARARLAVLISGRGSNMAALLHAQRLEPACPYEIVLVASNVPEAEGLRRAEAEGIATFALSHKGLPRTAFDARIEEALAAHHVSHVALAGYMRLLSPGFTERWAGRCFNIHPSLLPAHKGLDPHAAVLAAGEPETGCTVHLVTAELDGGPILGQARVPVLPGDTADSLAARVLIAEHQLYPRTLMRHLAAEVAPLTRLRALALRLPAAAERLSQGNPGFFVEGGKFFAYFTENHHNDGITAVLLRTSGLDEQAALLANDPALYFRPAYFGPSGWIGLRLGPESDWAHIEALLAQSWAHAAPRRLLRLIHGP